MSHFDEYADDEELADFIVSDEESRAHSHAQNASFLVNKDPVEGYATRLTASQEPNSAQKTTGDKLKQLGNTHFGAGTETTSLLKAHIAILVSALGGPDHTSSEIVYKLGHDALACLKDLKRWLRAVDEKNGGFAVAHACAECDLVKNDLIVILCQFDRGGKGNKRSRATEKIMLACLELLVLLTWPTEIDKSTSLKDYTAKTTNRRAQLGYKQHILSYKNGKTLKAVLRLGLIALRTATDEREPRDLNILRLILFFIRNVLYIEPLPATKGPKAVANGSNLPNGLRIEDISLPTVILAFEKNNVFLFLTSIAHSVSTDIVDEGFGLLVMECFSLLTRGVCVPKLVSCGTDVLDSATTVPPASSVIGMGLGDLLKEEKRRHAHANNTISSRHGRFGTLLSLRNASNASYYAVSGQKALKGTYDTLQKLDSTKTWHRMSTLMKQDSDMYARNPSIILGGKVSQIFSKFIDNLLTSGSFNNVLIFVGRHLTNLANDRDLGRRGILDVVDPAELASYFVTIAWFFRYKRERAQAYSEMVKQPPPDEDGIDYGSVGAALSETNFILLISYLRSSFEAKDYNSLHVAMLCFREMLLISHTLFSKQRTQKEIELLTEADINEDRELAEGIIRKLFTQKQFLDMCVSIPKTAARHSPAYLGVVVSVVHILLKCFESLANEDIHLYIKTRRRTRKLKKNGGLNSEMDREHIHLIDRGSDEEDDPDQIRYITHERKLDLRKTEVMFFHPEIIATHIEYLSKYEDLTPEELKKALSYFHRIFVVRKDFSALYRLDFMLLLYKLQAYLPRSSSNRRHVDEFIVYYMKKFKSALERFPTALELLFPRMENAELKGFLSTGDLQTFEVSSEKKKGGLSRGKNSYFEEDASQPRAAPILEFHDDDQSLDEKIGILVYFLVKKKNTTTFLKNIDADLQRIAEIPYPYENAVILRLNLGNRRLLISDSHARLLLESIGFALPFLQNDDTKLRPSVSPDIITKARGSIQKWSNLHAMGMGDVEPFLDQIHHTILSSELIDFGEECLKMIKDGKAYDTDRAAELDLDDAMVHNLIGLARRREYDESQASFEEDDDFIHVPLSAKSAVDMNDSSDIEVSEKPKRKRGGRSVTSVDEINSDSILDDTTPKKSNPKRRRIKKIERVAMSEDEEEEEDEDEDEQTSRRSAEMVHDSDDESDEERNNAFFEKEEKLRQLISETGGISSKVQLNMFRETWASILQSRSTGKVAAAVEKASSLFVDIQDYETVGDSGDVGSVAPLAKEADGSESDATKSDATKSNGAEFNGAESDSAESDSEDSEHSKTQSRKVRYRRVIDDDDDE